jgi:tRNA dimethylallyltransferase
MARPLYLCGPTASGKSALALELAVRFDGEIVNGDAFQLYRGLPVLTAAPGPDELARVRHHLYQILDPRERCDAMAYRRLAAPVLEDIRGRGKTPVVVGGSGLYLKFLSHGPSPLPPGDPELRRELERHSLDELVTRLTALDPVEAARTDLENRRYVTRALEICLLAGRPCSELRDRWASRRRECDAALRGLYLQRPREQLHRRIEARTDHMLESGALDEVRALGDCPEHIAGIIGVGPIREFLAGRIDRETCRHRILTATRQYAKRQETWFRRERWLQRLDWPEGTPPEALASSAERLLREA